MTELICKLRICWRNTDMVGRKRMVRQLGVDRSTLYRWLVGYACPSPLALEKIQDFIENQDKISTK